MNWKYATVLLLFSAVALGADILVGSPETAGCNPIGYG
jgi:hypothetical protein